MMTNTTSVSNVDGGFKPSGTFASVPYFDCDDSTFQKCYHSKKKGKHWNTHLGKSEFTNNLKSWLKKNKNASFMLKNTSDSSMLYAHKTPIKGL